MHIKYFQMRQSLNVVSLQMCGCHPNLALGILPDLEFVSFMTGVEYKCIRTQR